MRIWPFSRTETKSLTYPERWEMDLFGLVASAAENVSVTPGNAMRCAAVRRAIQAIAEPIGQLPLHVYRRDGEGRERDREHAVAKVLIDPNEWTSSSDFREQLQRDCLLHGNGYAFINRVDGKIAELTRIEPTRVQVATDQWGEPTYTLAGLPSRKYPARDIFHLKSPSTDGIKGKSIVNDCGEAIRMALVMEEHGLRLFASGAHPGGVIETPKNVGDEGAKKMLKGWRAAFSGAKDAGKTAVLWDGAKWTKMALSSVDSQFLELRKYSVDEIARAFGVPPHLLYELGRATWGNAGEMGSMFVTFTLMRWVKAWQGEIRLKLFTPEERNDFYAEFLIDDLLKADLTARATAYSQARTAGWLNADEIRARENLPPIPNGEGQSYANPNTATQPEAGNPPKPDNDDDDDRNAA